MVELFKSEVTTYAELTTQIIRKEEEYVYTLKKTIHSIN